jgi:protein gp37
MSDLFHEGLTNEEIGAVFGVMAACPQHTFQILTKRAQRMAKWFEWVSSHQEDHGPPPDAVVSTCAANYIDCDQLVRPWPLPNVWMGVSCEDQQRADERLPILAQVPAAVRFVSYEPALGPLDLRIDHSATTRPLGLLTCPKCGGWGGQLTSLYPDVNGHEQVVGCKHCKSDGCAIDWLIIGGESGPGARPFDVEWARSVIGQCKDAGVSVFCKQFGANPFADGKALRLADRKGGSPEEWPAGDFPREWPS